MSDSVEKYYNDEWNNQNLFPEFENQEIKTVLNFYKALSFEDKINFNRILRENKYYYV